MKLTKVENSKKHKMQVEKAFHKLKQKLSKVDFASIIKDFHRFPFAIYTRQEILLDDQKGVFSGFEYREGIYRKTWDDRFLGNTAIKVDGNLVAIWDFSTCSENMDIDQLTSKIVHEMFHCFQQEYKENRWADESLGLKYPLSSKNLSMKVLENRSLQNAFKTGNDGEIVRFLELRSQRSRMFGRYIDYESAIETYEGMAVFVELSSLSFLKGVKTVDLLGSYLPSDILEAKFLINHRVPGYYAGLMIAFLLEKNVKNWEEQFFEKKDYLWQILADEKLENDKEEEIPVSKESEEAVDFRRKEIENTFFEFMSFKTYSIKKSYRLTGFDPMNAICFENMVYHRYFVKLRDGAGEYLLEGPVVTRFEESIFEVSEIITQRDIKM